MHPLTVLNIAWTLALVACTIILKITVLKSTDKLKEESNYN